eukprot:TRINITY_DN71534_c0_g1_i1.p1 TRINITY_DN71534_c0_g1~~TRINITY_DN71534_c0_g1_i1.p1  ORF type:complete len:794 (+),score=160.22 TRINITY_DN71534_c0_g1_i1:94-2475(+)
MDVLIRSCDEVTPGTLLSVKVGGVRRQAVLECGRPLRFPAEAASASEIQVDVLELRGRGKIKLQQQADCEGSLRQRHTLLLSPPASKGVDGGNAAPPAGQPFRCELELRQRERGGGAAQKVGTSHCQERRSFDSGAALSSIVVDESAAVSERPVAGGSTCCSVSALDASGLKRSFSKSSSARKGTRSRKNTRHEQALAAEKYMEQHNLVAIVQALLQAAVSERSETPLEFMAVRLMVAASGEPDQVSEVSQVHTGVSSPPLPAAGKPAQAPDAAKAAVAGTRAEGISDAAEAADACVLFMDKLQERLGNEAVGRPGPGGCGDVGKRRESAHTATPSTSRRQVVAPQTLCTAANGETRHALRPPWTSNSHKAADAAKTDGASSDAPTGPLQQQKRPEEGTAGGSGGDEAQAGTSSPCEPPAAPLYRQRPPEQLVSPSPSPSRPFRSGASFAAASSKIFEGECLRSELLAPALSPPQRDVSLRLPSSGGLLAPPTPTRLAEAPAPCVDDVRGTDAKRTPALSVRAYSLPALSADSSLSLAAAVAAAAVPARRETNDPTPERTACQAALANLREAVRTSEQAASNQASLVPELRQDSSPQPPRAAIPPASLVPELQGDNSPTSPPAAMPASASSARLPSRAAPEVEAETAEPASRGSTAKQASPSATGSQPEEEPQQWRCSPSQSFEAGSADAPRRWNRSGPAGSGSPVNLSAATAAMSNSREEPAAAASGWWPGDPLSPPPRSLASGTTVDECLLDDEDLLSDLERQELERRRASLRLLAKQSMAALMRPHLMSS